MHFDFHSFMTFIHVALFVYAIGGDIAVYYLGKYLVREDLDLDERLRVRDIRLIVDMSARTSLVLLLAVGFTLAVPYGSPITGAWLVLLWVADLAWLALVWLIHQQQGTERGIRLRQVDIRIRYAVAAAMIGFGSYCLYAGSPVYAGWLATKIILYGVIILNGIWIRMIIARWQGAFELVRAGGNDRVRGELLMKEIQGSTNRAAFSIWVLVMLMALIGEMKPF